MQWQVDELKKNSFVFTIIKMKSFKARWSLDITQQAKIKDINDTSTHQNLIKDGIMQLIMYYIFFKQLCGFIFSGKCDTFFQDSLINRK